MRAGLIWDDNDLLFENRPIRETSGLYHFWLTRNPPDYFPLTWTSFWLEWRLWGQDPTGYHVVNVVLHALSSVVLWRVLRRLAVPGALVAAAIFAVHPVTVASVAWISERKNTLCMLLYLLSLLTYLHFEERGHWRRYVLTLGLFCLALLAKTSVVMLPAVLLLLAWWRRGRLAGSDLLRTSPFFVLSFVLGLVTVYFQQHDIGSVVVRPEGVFSRLAAMGWCVWFYLYKALVPIDLAMIYPRWHVNAANPLAWGPLLGLVAAGYVLGKYRNGWAKTPLVTLGYSVLMLLPVLGMINMSFHRFSLVADHLQYAALIGPIVLLTATATHFAKRYRSAMPVAKLAVVSVLVVLSVLTWHQAGAYEDEATLWIDTLKKNPNAWAAHNNLGNVLADRGDRQTAISHYEEALKINPFAANALVSLGVELTLQQKYEQAIDYYHRALAINPRHAKAHNNLANTLSVQGNDDLAIRHYRLAIWYKPDYGKAHFNWAMALRKRGQWTEAIDHLRQAVILKPEVAKVHHHLGQALDLTGQLLQAIVHYEEALRLEPDSLQTLNNLAWLLATQADARIRNPPKSIELARRAAELTHRQDAAVLDTLAAAHAADAQFKQAIKIAQEARALAEINQATELGRSIAKRLELYRQSKPLRDPKPDAIGE